MIDPLGKMGNDLTWNFFLKIQQVYGQKMTDPSHEKISLFYVENVCLLG